jgi:cytochrome c biogenesis factor
VDVTEKPLIQLVWIGLWVILMGGGLAVFQRLRQALQGAPHTVPADNP